MEFHSKNPVLNNIESKTKESGYSFVSGETASFTGISIKTGILLSIIFVISIAIYYNLETLASYLVPMMIGGMIVGFISVIVAGTSQKAAPFFTILYAVSEGLVLGTISSLVETLIPGIVANAIIITFAIFGFLLIAYATGIFKVGIRFRKFVYTAMIGVLFFILISWILSFFGIGLFSGIASPGLLVVVTIAMILLASFNLLIDFDNCKIAVQNGVPSRYEWFLSLGLLVSLVWLYIEILRLLLILSSYFRD